MKKLEVKEPVLVGNMPEAKSSVSYSLVSKGGYPLIFTVRSHDEAELLDTMRLLETKLATDGYTPEVKKSYGFPAKPAPQVVEGEICPKCGSPLIKFTSKDGTKSGVKCSTSKYDFMTKTAGGCDFVRFNDSNSSEGATGAQMTLLKEKGLWDEGMTQAQASKVIGEVLGK